MASLDVVHVSKRFGTFTAVDDFSLSVADGEFIAILGPSGCGKSTTLNMIVGLEVPTHGEILFDGNAVTHLSPQKRNIGMVFQDYAIFEHMNAFDNLAFGLKIRKTPKAEIKRAVADVARILDLDGALDRPVRSLNLSELQRVAIGRTLVTNPAVLLFDEPLSNLEASLRARMRTELKTLQERLRWTAIYVTHDQIEAMALANRIAVMNRGRLQQFDTPEGVYDQPANAFVAGFIGSPPMNLIPGQFRSEHGQVVLDCEDFVLAGAAVDALGRAASARSVRFGIRPEHVHFVADDDNRDWPGLRAVVYAVEPLGPETIVDFRAGRHLVRAVTPGAATPRVGDALTLGLDPRKLHLFDAETGEALRATRGVGNRP